MFRNFAFKLATISLFLPTFSYAADELVVEGKFIIESCQYWNSNHASLRLEYRNEELPADAKIFLRFGVNYLEGEYGPAPTPWQAIQEKQLVWEREGVWQLPEFRLFLQGRQARRSNQMQFALRVELPDGVIYWKNGGLSSMGYYYVDLRQDDFPEASRSCVGQARTEDEIPFALLAIQKTE